MSAAQPAGHRVSVSWRGRTIDLEVAWVGAADAAAPVVVFLHEGLGSVSAWRGFPHAFCTELALRGLVYSRYGYGGSALRPPGEHWAPDFMHQQAHEVLPALLEALGVQRPWLFGHSDGASIALLYASRFPVAGLVLVAPHLFVEDVSIESIARARDAYAATDLRGRLARHHADPDSAFRGWCDAWLNPAFRRWNIEADIATIQAPILAVQGESDEYGTLEQIHAIQRRLPKTRLLVLPDCGHSPHRDQPTALTREAGRFIRSHLSS
jgi:pimeloyl-ACP methyl ester carboxylesterase